MSCPKEIELIRLVSGELGEADAEALRRHAASCASCSALLAAQARTWEALGAWVVEDDADVAGRVGDLLDAETSVPHRPMPWAGRMAGLRMAASLAFAVLLGIAAGRAVPLDGDSSDNGTSGAAENPLESLGADDLLAGAATRLPLTLAEDIAYVEEDAS